MAVGINMPVAKQKEDALDKIAKGLQVANGIIGLGTGIAGVTSAISTAQEAARMKDPNSKESQQAREYYSPLYKQATGQDLPPLASAADIAKLQASPIISDIAKQQSSKFTTEQELKKAKELKNMEIAANKEKMKYEAEHGIGQFKPGDTEFTAARFASKADAANKVMEGLAAPQKDAAGNVIQPGFQAGEAYIQKSGWFPEAFKSENVKKQENAQRAFINAILRKESGAAIAPSEFENYAKEYFPQAGDTEEVLAQKSNNRSIAIRSLKAEGRNASRFIEPDQGGTAFANAPAPAAGLSRAAGPAMPKPDEATAALKARGWTDEQIAAAQAKLQGKTGVAAR